MDTSRISQGNYSEDNLLRLLPQEPQNWNLDNPCLSRKCMEMFGEQLPLINQLLNRIPYWVRFPDNSILRRTRSMIKPRSSPSHFELQAEAQQRNFEGETSFTVLIHPSTSWMDSQCCPVAPMASVTTPATIDRDSQVGATRSYHRGHQSHRWQGEPPPSPQMTTTPRRSTRSTKRCSSSLLHPPSRKW